MAPSFTPSTLSFSAPITVLTTSAGPTMECSHEHTAHNSLLPVASPVTCSHGPSSTRHGETVPGIHSMANKRCAHAATHACQYLADSNSELCPPCAYAAARGQPCA